MASETGYPRLDGKVCLVTGATSGIGKATAIGLAKLGAQVVMVGRNPTKSAMALDDVRRQSGVDTVQLLHGDLASLASVRALAADFLSAHDSLYALVNNAGVMQLRGTLSQDGFENNFAVNYVAPFLLTNLLLGAIKASAPARIVNVSSAAHYSGKLNLTTVRQTTGGGMFGLYSRSKLAVVLFTYELARRLADTGVTANCLHPGVVATNLGSSSGVLVDAFFNLGRPLLTSPEKSAEALIRLVADPALATVTGQYFNVLKSARSAPVSYDTQLASHLWNETAHWVGLTTPAVDASAS
ncbi:MAG: SDR family oxidoreductase [Ktedonobacterales bacterium]